MTFLKVYIKILKQAWHILKNNSEDTRTVNLWKTSASDVMSLIGSYVFPEVVIKVI